MSSSAQTLWQHLAQVIATLPPQEQARFQREIAMFAHDLRQSLGSIVGAETLLRRTAPLDADATELLDVIHKATQRAVRLVTDMARPFDSDLTIPSGYDR